MKPLLSTEVVAFGRQGKPSRAGRHPLHRRRSCQAFCALFLIALCGACDLFPEELLDAGPDMGTFALSDHCTDAPVVTTNINDALVDLTGLADDVDAVAACIGANAPGADGFFAIEMATDDKWHFHLRNMSASGYNPALYVLDSACDARRCTGPDGIDLCSDGRDEHLTFVAPRAGTFFVGIDSRVVGEGQYELLAIHPTCGDGNLEHSEGCDDENTDSGDGCDSKCRVELSATERTEVEPNDDFTGANLVLESVDVDGSMRECDADLYVVDLPSGGDLQVEMFAAGGVACAPTTAIYGLDLMDDEARSVRMAGSIEDGNACPVLQATGLAAGEHIVAISGEEGRLFNYVLRFTME